MRNLMDNKKILSDMLDMVDKGLTEIGCPDCDNKLECLYFGQQSEYGKCYRDDWYNCPLWRDIL